jgi:hypothetical protein
MGAWRGNQSQPASPFAFQQRLPRCYVALPHTKQHDRSLNGESVRALRAYTEQQKDEK